jgi:hypothetical protein
VYGIDSRGLLCGSNNTYNGSVMDLTDKPNLYYLNALELLDAANIMYAKTVCVASCQRQPVPVPVRAHSRGRAVGQAARGGGSHRGRVLGRPEQRDAGQRRLQRHLPAGGCGVVGSGAVRAPLATAMTWGA